MTIFKYHAVDCYGKEINGYVEAASVDSVLLNLKDTSLKVLKIKKALFQNFIKNLFVSKVSLLDLSIWANSVLQLLKVELSITKALNIVVNNEENNHKSNKLKNITLEMCHMIEQGVSLFKVSEKYKHVFGGLFVGLMEVAESTGKLKYAFEYLSTYYTFLHNTKRQIMSACYYPILLSVIVLPVSMFFMLYLMPIFGQMIIECKGDLPAFTGFLCKVSDLLQHNLDFVLILGSVFILMIFVLYRAFYKQIINMLSRIPFLGKMIHYFYLSVFFQVFSQMIKQNMCIVKALEVGHGLLKGRFAQEVFEIKEQLLIGNTISQALKGKSFITDITHRLLTIGEETGTLDEVSLQIGLLYQNKLTDGLNKIQQSITPIFICFLGLLFFMIVFAGLMPLYNALSIQDIN